MMSNTEAPAITISTMTIKSGEERRFRRRGGEEERRRGGEEGHGVAKVWRSSCSC
jgi:hypothetical protein